MEDYEQLYYDSLYTIKKLKQQNETLENDLQLVNKNKIKDVRVKNIILEQMKKKVDRKIDINNCAEMLALGIGLWLDGGTNENN